MPIARLPATLAGAYLPSTSSVEEIMTNVLIVDSAATGDASVSRRLTGELEAILRGRGPVSIVRRDVGSDPAPPLTAATTPAIRGGEAETEAARDALALSDALIAELKAADLVVLGAPM